MVRSALVVAFAALSLAACGRIAQPASDSPVEAARPAAFAVCASCHDGRAGPPLAGVYGAKAGHRGTFAYSQALRDSGLTWDDATLDKWIANPRALVPGTRMYFAGLPDPAQRQAIVAYLMTLR
jgi:cytochrome c